MAKLIHHSKTKNAVSWRDLIGHRDCNTRTWAEVMGWRAFADSKPVATKTLAETNAFWSTLDTQIEATQKQ